MRGTGDSRSISKAALSRRGFLQATAAASAAFAAPTFLPARALGAGGWVAPSERVGIGMIGLGREAIHKNLPVFLRHPLSQVVALCDVDRWRLEQQQAKEPLKGCFATTDFRQLLDRPDVDGVMVTTPDHSHVPIAMAAIRAGKDVSCEKPIGLCIEHGRLLADAAAEANCVFRTDSEFRSIPLWFRAVSLVRTGKIGQLRTMRMAVPLWNRPLPMQPEMPIPDELDYDLWLGPAPDAPYTEQRVHPRRGYGRPGWYANRTYCDGVISNWGYHPADIAQWGNDSERTGPVEIEGRGDFPPRDGLWNVMLGFDVRYRYADGVELFYTALSDTSQGQSYVRFEGTEGWICVWYGPDRLEAQPESILEAEVGPEEFPFQRKNEKHDFIDCMVSRSRTLQDAEVGHRSSSIGQLGYIACQVERKLTWDPAAERFAGDEEANELLGLPPARPPWDGLLSG